MSKGVFITATGTDVGKTYISSLILKKMRQLGLNAGYFKSALSGATFDGEKLIKADCMTVAQNVGINIETTGLTPYLFKAETSPHLAAALENKVIDKNVIKTHFDWAKKSFDYIVAEGSGGIICPLNITPNNRLMLSDIIKMTGMRIIIVSPSGLGAINDTFLTCFYAQSEGIGVNGIILNNFDDTNIIHKDNLKTIPLLTEVPVLATVAKGANDIDISADNLITIFNEV